MLLERRPSASTCTWGEAILSTNSECGLNGLRASRWRRTWGACCKKNWIWPGIVLLSKTKLHVCPLWKKPIYMLYTKKFKYTKKFYVWKNILALSWLVLSTGCTEWWILLCSQHYYKTKFTGKKREFLESLSKIFTTPRDISESNTSEHSWGSGQYRECQNKWAKSQGAIRLQMRHLEERYIKNLQENHTQPWQ